MRLATGTLFKLTVLVETAKLIVVVLFLLSCHLIVVNTAGGT